ncbi:hypothetical protein ACS0TY_027182 [Phlomoides rotata]
MHNFLVHIRTLSHLEDDIPPCEAQMEHWKTNLLIMESKERQYLQQYSVIKHLLVNRVGYSPEISHGVLDEMAEHRKDLEKETKPILDMLRSYQDLPTDKALAALAIEDKKRQYAAAEKYLETCCSRHLLLPSDSLSPTNKTGIAGKKRNRQNNQIFVVPEIHNHYSTSLL